MAYETLIVDFDDHIAHIRFNRPDHKNTLNQQMLGELLDALDVAARNEKARCILLSGTEKAFCTGLDVAELVERGFADLFCEDFPAAGGQAVARVRKPVVAAVSGYAAGAGCEIAMQCDIIIAADTAKFGLPEVNLGVMSSLGGTQRLVRAVGKAKAMDMHLTGRFITAEDAERAGLVSRVVPSKKLMDEARSVAMKITEKSTVSLRAVKESVNHAFESPLQDGLVQERRLYQALFSTSDQSEGMSAYLEKREPQFRDR